MCVRAPSVFDGDAFFAPFFRHSLQKGARTLRDVACSQFACAQRGLVKRRRTLNERFLNRVYILEAISVLILI